MGSKAIEIGPVGRLVAQAVTSLRQARGWNQQQLSRELARHGRPIPYNGVFKIENAERRVDMDDLWALAKALETTPEDLMEGGYRSLAGLRREQSDEALDRWAIERDKARAKRVKHRDALTRSEGARS